MSEEFNAEELELIEYLKTEGYFEFRKVANFGLCGLQKFVFTTGIVVGLNKIGYYGRYCYSDYNEASDELKKIGVDYQYVILDDDIDMLYTQKNNFVNTNSDLGLTETDCEIAIQILNREYHF